MKKAVNAGIKAAAGCPEDVAKIIKEGGYFRK